MKLKQFGSTWQRLPDLFYIARQYNWYRTLKLVRRAAGIEARAHDWEFQSPLHLSDDNPPQVCMALNEQEVIWRLHRKPAAKPRLNLR
jgi:hypothetical protein